MLFLVKFKKKRFPKEKNKGPGLGKNFSIFVFIKKEFFFQNI